jgi:hypothetical protein
MPRKASKGKVSSSNRIPMRVPPLVKWPLREGEGGRHLSISPLCPLSSEPVIPFNKQLSKRGPPFQGIQGIIFSAQIILHQIKKSSIALSRSALFFSY